MLEFLHSILFFVAVTVFCIVWGVSSRILYESPRRPAFAIFWCMALSGLDYRSAAVLVKGMCYIFVGVAGVLIFAELYHFSLSSMFFLQSSYVILALLGGLAEISITALLMKGLLSADFCARDSIPAQLLSIPWFRGLLESPKPLRVLGIIASASVEEVFFRGGVFVISFYILHNSLFVSVLISTVIFSIQQGCQVKTVVQGCVITCSCVSISLIGCLLVLETGSIVPSAVAHALLVVFYFRDVDPAELAEGRRERDGG